MPKTKKLRFIVNTHYDGKLVGPGTEFETLEVDVIWAKQFIENNAAVLVKESKPPKQS